MNPALYLCMFLPIFIIIFSSREEENQRAVCFRRERKRGSANMNDLIRRFLGKQCTVYLGSTGGSLQGVVETVEGNWVSIKTKTGTELVNLDYISRMKEKVTK